MHLFGVFKQRFDIIRCHRELDVGSLAVHIKRLLGRGRTHGTRLHPKSSSSELLTSRWRTMRARLGPVAGSRPSSWRRTVVYLLNVRQAYRSHGPKRARGRFDSERYLRRLWTTDWRDRPSSVALRGHVRRAPFLPLDGCGPIHAQRTHGRIEVDSAVDTVPVVFDTHVTTPTRTAVLAIAALRGFARRRCAFVLLTNAEDGCKRRAPWRSLVVKRRGGWGVGRIRLVAHRPQQLGTRARLRSIPGEMSVCIMMLAVAPHGGFGAQRGRRGWHRRWERRRRRRMLLLRMTPLKNPQYVPQSTHTQPTHPPFLAICRSIRRIFRRQGNRAAHRVPPAPMSVHASIFHRRGIIMSIINVIEHLA